MVKVLTDANFKEEIKEGVVVVDFYADWCGPCKMMAPVLDSVSEKVEDFTVMKLNVTDNPKTATEYKIMSIPAFGIFKDGELLGMLGGFKPEEVFVQEVRNVIG